MSRVLVCDPIDDEGIKMLKSAGLDVDYRPSITPAELKQDIKGYDGVVVRSRTKITREVIESGSRLKAIGRAGVGLDNIDLVAAKEKGIKVVNAPESLTQSVVEMVTGFMIALSRYICNADKTMKEGKWLKTQYLGNELNGKTLGIVGFGRIGRGVAKVARALGMKIVAFDVIPIDEKTKQELALEQLPLEEVLRVSDFVTLHVPGGQGTYHLIDLPKLKLMKPSSFIINTSRGNVVKEEDLIYAIKNKIIAGAALDVFEVEPPSNKELFTLERIILTPHVGGETAEAQKLAATLTVQRLIEAINS
ncbi:MAG: D-2-hydroxyacid dehydrogenase [Nitrososphaerota archaeon]|jgi:D-3-phosphoglycerate dehydrogenase|nr:D-2-hydroxyacid dehydrogenase [Nitrososphaerota archaeon]MDG6928257.1 D-2-hydroxyacid dehydrogenase [Nitrososphaerota archaeon]MDG6930954.1 D-2-hydroxyacid dehydrogenase [Nitrososphaerota archaeon]MDG6932930.1 D-2-hydroxyacid dehydrogenase [Nitrososphaerota archaeon]MDG6936351.1 D-2-hydroxyacid dehydrogenase [Nitrososphaerota archaeon]